MKAHTASLINAAVLSAVSVVGYAISGSVTALIPLAFGLALLACYPGVKAENKLIAHVAAALTLVVFVALFMPLFGAIGRGDGLAILRLTVMLAATAFALVSFVRSFMEARRRKEV